MGAECSRAAAPSRFTLGLGWAALAALCGAALVSPEWLARFSPDGALSLSLQERLQGLRLLALVCGTIALTVAAWRWLGAVVGLLACWIACVVTVTVIEQIYPDHWLHQPQRILRAALGQELLLRDFEPRAHLVVPRQEIRQAKFPVINIHAHFHYTGDQRSPEEMLAIMAQCRVVATANLDGVVGEFLEADLARFVQPHPERFLELAQIGFGPVMDWAKLERDTQLLPAAKQAGAVGLKIWKTLGLKTRDEHGRLITLDDPRVDVLWQRAGEAGLPILIHVADLPANFEPLDRYNERYEYLHQERDIAYHGPGGPGPEEVLAQFERVMARHREATFILAHLGNRTDNLAEAAALLDRHPNLYMDISARANELGRQPVTARQFFIRYAGRLLFGTDGNPDEAMYRGYFRLLETADEYFDDPKWPKFRYGRWKLYGLNLPDDVLRRVYYDNALQVFGLEALRRSLRERAGAS
jgi:predicted TIM-barrel fold metal-dependent hydrolase